MNMEQQFNQIAKEYDANRKKFIPCFDDFYGRTTDFIAANICTPKRILDLGAGTGLLSAFWAQHFGASEYVLVDIADEMIQIARKRFEGLPNVSYEIMDYSEKMPEQDRGMSEWDLELWKERRKLDKECPVEEEVAMLEKCKFKNVKCVYSYQKFSVIFAVKYACFYQ